MDRRKFLKTSGILGVGGVLSSCDVQKKLSAQTAKNTSLGGIAKEAEKLINLLFQTYQDFHEPVLSLIYGTSKPLI